MRYPAYILLAILILWGCSQQPPRPAQSQEEEAAVAAESQPATGLVFQLGEGSPGGAAEANPQAQVRPLSDAEAQAVLRRLPPFKVPGQAEDFALREKSQPPPRTGKTMDQPFP
ncbi:MAG: hypothetical protein AB1758_32660, partial [Candidatus Eremiobacterota bacterium]